MKVDLYKLILAGLALLTGLTFTSCYNIDNNGIPKKIYFPKEGGMEVFMAEQRPIAISLGDRPDSIWNSGDTIYYTYQWVTVGISNNTQKWLVVKTDSNKTGKKRSRWIFPDFGSEFGETKIIQSK